MFLTRAALGAPCVGGVLAIAGALMLPDAALGESDAVGQPGQSAFLLPLGEYRTSQELIALDVPGLSESGRLIARDAFTESAAVPYSCCVSEGEPHGEWLSDMVESDCTLMHFFVEQGVPSIGFACRSENAVDGPLQLSGTTHAQGADMEMTFTRAFPRQGRGHDPHAHCVGTDRGVRISAARQRVAC